MVDTVIKWLDIVKNRDKRVVPKKQIQQFVEHIHRQFEHDGDR